jgi:hypothetical protein
MFVGLNLAWLDSFMVKSSPYSSQWEMSVTWHHMNFSSIQQLAYCITWLVNGRWKIVGDCAACCLIEQCSVLIVAIKWKCLDLNTKIEVMHIFEFGGSSEGKVRLCYGLTSLILFTVWKSKDILQSAVLCVWRPVTKKEMQNASNEELESAF